jgi:spermidine synthase
VIPRVVIERVASPGGELVLSRRGTEYSIRVGGVELMSSRDHSSEDELGRASAERVRAARPKAPRMLIGGLGMGFTLRAALDALPRAAQVDVVEIVPAIVRWNRGELGPLANAPLADPRVTVIEADVARVIDKARGYHAIVLDVDNGPAAVYEGNAALYKQRGLAAARDALAPGGWLAVWSSFTSQTFTRWLREVGFAVEMVTVKSRGGPRHYVWFAQRAATLGA